MKFDKKLKGVFFSDICLIRFDFFFLNMRLILKQKGIFKAFIRIPIFKMEPGIGGNDFIGLKNLTNFWTIIC